MIEDVAMESWEGGPMSTTIFYGGAVWFGGRLLHKMGAILRGEGVGWLLEFWWAL